MLGSLVDVDGLAVRDPGVGSALDVELGARRAHGHAGPLNGRTCTRDGSLMLGK